MLKNLTLILIASILATSCTKKGKDSNKNIVHSFLDANIAHLDPIHSTNKYSSIINSSIFEGLYHYHYFKRPITLEPQLAEAMPEVSSNGLEYTIKIKKGVVFQDDPAFENGKGRELVAEDFIFSWKRLADPKTKALGWWLFDGLIVGLNEWRDKMREGSVNYESPVAGLQAIDTHTLKVTLTRKSFQFLHFLATPPTMVVAKEVVNKYGKEIINHPVGTGAFYLKSWTRNSEVRLVKNPSYREVLYPSEASEEIKKAGLLKNAGKRLPLADEINVKIYTERQPLWLAFLKGELDHGIIPKDNYDQVFENDRIKPIFTDRGIGIHYQFRPDVVYLSFNMENPILGKNKKLRQALASALDKKLILEKFYNKRGTVAETPIPPGLDAYDPNYKHPVQFDIEKAKKLMAEAGYPNGKGLPVFDYDLPNVATWARHFGEYLKDTWSKIGVNIKLQTNTWPQFDKKIKTKKATMFDMAWMADYPDSENFLQLFYSKNISPGPNNSNFVNREYDDIYEQSVNLKPGPKRTELFKKMRDIINDEMPAIFTVHRIFRLPYHGWLEGYYEFPIVYEHLKYMSVDKNKKKELKRKL